MVKHKVDARNFFILGDEKEASQKFLGDGKRSLPDFCCADLFENPFDIHYLIARQLQKVKSADCIVALVFVRFKPLAYLFSKFVVHKKVSLLILHSKLTLKVKCLKRRYYVGLVMKLTSRT